MLRIYAPFMALLALVLITTPSWAQGININNVTVTEGNSGQVDATFQVTLTAASQSEVKVKYATEAGTATSGAACGAADFLASTGGLTFPAGSVSQPLTVKVCGDTSDEPDETFRVRLTQALGGTIQDNQGDGTITDDDQPPTPPPGGGTDVRRPDPTAPPIVPTSTDLTLGVGQQVLDGPLNWVTEIKLGTPGDIAPNGLRFNWSRPAVRAVIGRTEPTEALRGALTEKAQWQMVFSATPTQTVMFLPSSETARGGLPLFVLYSYGSVYVASSGSSAEFAIPAAKFPANPPGGVISVRVVLSTSTGLRASEWVKISMLGPQDPVRIAVPEPNLRSTALSITQTQIEVVRETSDTSPEDEIFIVLVAADLTSGGTGGGVTVKISPVYDFDLEDPSMRVRSPNMTIWGPYGTNFPMAIVDPDAAFIMAVLLESDGDSPNPASYTTNVQNALRTELETLRNQQVPRAVIIDQLAEATVKLVNIWVAPNTDSKIVGWGTFESGAERIWKFTTQELEDARDGEVVEREFLHQGMPVDGAFPVPTGSLADDNSLYKVRFRLSKAVAPRQ
jgi:hypothetical protein